MEVLFVPEGELLSDVPASGDRLENVVLLVQVLDLVTEGSQPGKKIWNKVLSSVLIKNLNNLNSS